MTEADLNHVATIDEYCMRYTVFCVYGKEVHLFDEHLCEAIKALSQRQRNIVLISYFLEMSDIEIGEIIDISRCSVYWNRMRVLNIIREKYTED